MIKIKKLSPQAILPQRATPHSAGMDLHACIDAPVVIASGETCKIPTGIAIELPRATAGFLFARSGLGIKHGIVPANAVGVVDCDYRGEVVVGLHNHGKESYTVAPQERIAQMVVMPVLQEEICLCEELDDTVRGKGGFGSTGKQ